MEPSSITSYISLKYDNDTLVETLISCKLIFAHLEGLNDVKALFIQQVFYTVFQDYYFILILEDPNVNITEVFKVHLAKDADKLVVAKRAANFNGYEIYVNMFDLNPADISPINVIREGHWALENVSLFPKKLTSFNKRIVKVAGLFSQPFFNLMPGANYTRQTPNVTGIEVVLINEILFVHSHKKSGCEDYMTTPSTEQGPIFMSV